MFKGFFFKTARHQKFHLEPRYYDPVKEDIENRTSRIKAEMGMSDGEMDPGYRSQIQGSFRKNMKHTPSQTGGQETMLRLIIFIVLVMTCAGFIYIGTEIFYLFLLFVPFYIYKRFKR
jgi:hypothetical protein